MGLNMDHVVVAADKKMPRAVAMDLRLRLSDFSHVPPATTDRCDLSRLAPIASCDSGPFDPPPPPASVSGLAELKNEPYALARLQRAFVDDDPKHDATGRGCEDRSHDGKSTPPAKVSSASGRGMPCFMPDRSGRRCRACAIGRLHQSRKIRRNLLDDCYAGHAGGCSQPRHDVRSVICPARTAEDVRDRPRDGRARPWQTARLYRGHG